MTIEQSKRNTKHFTFRDERFFIIFVGNGEDITPAEAKAWVKKYQPEAMKLPVDTPLIVDYDWERASSLHECLVLFWVSPQGHDLRLSGTVN